MHFKRCLFTVAASLLLCAAGFAQAPEEEKGLEGRWQGAILFEEGRIELDMVARFSRAEDGAWTAVLDLPLVGVTNLVVAPDVKGDRATLVVDLEDGAGTRTINVEVGSDGETLEGEFIQGRQIVPVYLNRRAAPQGKALPVTVTTLPAPGLQELRQRFNADRGSVRLLMLLAPS